MKAHTTIYYFVHDAKLLEDGVLRVRTGGYDGNCLFDGVVQEALARIASRAPERIVAHREKLRANVQEIAGGVAIDAQRIAQEVAILAERLDVGEELDRFASHIVAFREALRAESAEPVGKRLGFLLQEMLREANTTGSKANDAAMQKDVVIVKEELERIREQVENLE